MASEKNGIIDSAEQELIVREYCRLRRLPKLSEKDENRIVDILERAEHDGVLDLLITEADHFIDHRINSSAEEIKESDKDQLAVLREYIPAEIETRVIARALARAYIHHVVTEQAVNKTDNTEDTMAKAAIKLFQAVCEACGKPLTKHSDKQSVECSQKKHLVHRREG
jgi:translation initiation factor 2 beta subunit (eIF-2beta)/eIF-5